MPSAHLYGHYPIGVTKKINNRAKAGCACSINEIFIVFLCVCGGGVWSSLSSISLFLSPSFYDGSNISHGSKGVRAIEVLLSSAKELTIPTIVHMFMQHSAYWSSFRLVSVWGDTKEQKC